jgi:hypothetical protein
VAQAQNDWVAGIGNMGSDASKPCSVLSAATTGIRSLVNDVEKRGWVAGISLPKLLRPNNTTTREAEDQDLRPYHHITPVSANR